LESFAAIEVQAVDALMWPVHAMEWLQPDLPPSVPAWSGLATEHRNRIVAPDFLNVETVPTDRMDGMNQSSDPLATDLQPNFPQSSLTPLGWDPRTVDAKGGGE
jgi:hypothetical protein